VSMTNLRIGGREIIRMRRFGIQSLDATDKCAARASGLRAKRSI
jgi:hypothetical protein